MTAIDTDRAAAFGERLSGYMNHAAVLLMTSVGHRTGLFDTMAKRPSWTSETLADAAGLSERYVREWLGAMVTGEIVEYEPEAKTFRLPPEHAACLTRGSVPINFAASAQW